MDIKNKTVVANIKGVEIIVITTSNNRQVVPIEPICKVLGIDVKEQSRRIATHNILRPAAEYLSSAESSHAMLCLHMKYIPVWLFTIGSTENHDCYKLQWSCYLALCEFFKRQEKTAINQYRAENELYKQIIEMQNQLELLDEQQNTLVDKCFTLEDRLTRLQQERLHGQPRLFN